MKFFLISCVIAALLYSSIRADDRKVAIDAPKSNEKPGLGAGAHDKSKRSACGSFQTKLTPDQQNEAVNIHNTYRGNEKAANIIKLGWCDYLAALAQEWASKCIWQHGMTTDCNNQAIGQNMYISAGSTYPTVNMTDVCSSWEDEKQNWNSAAMQCKSGAVCGHWTQVAAARSSCVGCGYAFCPTVSVDGSAWTNVLIIVCNYSPAGNMDGTPVYQTGNVCSNCDSEQTGAGYKCSNNLCAKCTPATDPDPTCKCGTPPTCAAGTTWNSGQCACA